LSRNAEDQSKDKGEELDPGLRRDDEAEALRPGFRRDDKVRWPSSG